MKYQEALQFARKYSHVILLNRIAPSLLRSFVITFSFIVFIVSTTLLLLFQFGNRFVVLAWQYNAVIAPTLAPHHEKLLIACVISFLLVLFLYPLHGYARYFSLNSLERVFTNNVNRFRVSYEAAYALLAGEKNGFVRGLLDTPDSDFMVKRLLMSPADVLNHVANLSINPDIELSEYNKTVTLGSLWKLLYESSGELKTALLANKIQKQIFYDTCDWLDRMIEDDKRKSAWWWRENLSKMRGIGKSLSYGGTGYMSKYARELALYSGMKDVGDVLLHKDSIVKLEAALSKVRGANAVIVGSKGTGRHTVVMALARMIDQGDCYAEIEHKRMFEFDNVILGSLDNEQFQAVLTQCFEEAVIAKNIIFVFNDLPAIYDLGQKRGVNIFQLMERYVSHADVSIVCICDQQFYQNSAHKSVFDTSFEAIVLGDMNSKLLIPYIEDHAIIVERATGKFFPSYAVNTIAVTLTKYFVEDSPLVKASELMYKIATSTYNTKHVTIDEEGIADTIKSITGVSTGAIQGDEKDKLLNLEATLHQSVMGQNEAIKVVASTMRRSRAGLTSASKPIGSFLFLGPTGVGKTETAKTLAKVFFGTEDHMSRLDMGEYTMSGSSSRLLGDTNQDGDLANLIHTRPYGVLLLDEFEKSTTDVKDIFLNVLDEGVFTSGNGKTISARTQIIIATSNAGASYIKESGLSPNSTSEEVEKIKTTLIDTIIHDGIFRPELINRFDAVVVFHPLGDDSRTLIAKKMLEALKQRVLLQGYDVTFTDALVQKVLGGEGDVMFGGRAIQRNIQSEVEEVIAKKIIEGSLQPGDTILLDANDIE